ncbi:MAG: hypothetical protein U9O98_10370 [Asgard group archaeon]|nr:hypothetical protein [Asgard group archaeon]
MALQTQGLIIPRGLVLPLRLYNINGGDLENVSTIIEKLQEHEIEFKENRYYEGFSEVETDGNMISALYTIGQPITVQRLKEEQLSTERIYSQGRCEYIFHVKEKYLECRGPSWVIKKGLAPLSTILAIEFENIILDEGAMVKLCRDAAEVKYVQISDLNNPALSKIQLDGQVMDSAEWSIYRRQGIIRYFRGYIDLPTGGQISAQVSNKGSVLIYKRGEGIPAEDVISAVRKIMKLANGKH